MSNEKVQYWTKMKCKAARNLATVSECTEPEDERDAKACLAHVVKHGNSCDIAEAIVEAVEWVVAHLELKKHEEVTKVLGLVK